MKHSTIGNRCIIYCKEKLNQTTISIFRISTMSESRMSVEQITDDEDLKLQSNSVEDARSCSSSILNTPEKADDGRDDYGDDDDINVTLISTPFSRVPKQLQEHAMEQSCGPLNDKRKRLSGAGQKRLKRLVDSGYSRQEAFRMAQTPQEQSDVTKRPRNSDLNGSNTSGNPRPQKIRRQNWKANIPSASTSVQRRIDMIRHSGQSRGTEGKMQPLYRDVVSGVKLGILPRSYPNIELTTQQLIATQNEILIRVEKQRKDTLKPKFGHCAFKSGYLVIFCKNQETATWLKTIVPSLKPWEGAELVAVDEKDIPRPEILIGFFPWSAEDSNERILTLLESQNDGLAVDAWRILQRNIVNQHLELIFTVDGVSMNSIKSSEFVLDFKFGNAQIRKKFHKRNQTETKPGEGKKQLSGVSALRSNPSVIETHEETGDTEMISDIPGSSGVQDAGLNPEQSARTTKVELANQGSAPEYREINLHANPNIGNRGANVGKQSLPRQRGNPNKIIQ
ncbi:uncharacterized protein LOC128744557 isoform X2 [Sabethes cyaneus]|uniref:uncharacterized protein LOC128744557 isoform X2 n=1 Tax=Sabethes cyaneus TaxID=53552 RepID=UPI00237E71FD|nr:uncharacterized protein LOC128744557 isoform X2 [Sabethes cyaneus]